MVEAEGGGKIGGPRRIRESRRGRKKTGSRRNRGEQDGIERESLSRWEDPGCYREEEDCRWR